MPERRRQLRRLMAQHASEEPCAGGRGTSPAKGSTTACTPASSIRRAGCPTTTARRWFVPPPGRRTSTSAGISDSGAAWEPGELRPGLVAEVLRLYDQLRRQRQQVARFEELLEETLQRDAELDRGAERMLRQTRMLATTFRSYERRVADSNACDEHSLRERLMAEPAAAPVRAVIVTVADWIAEPGGLCVADFDLLARLPDLASDRRHRDRRRSSGPDFTSGFTIGCPASRKSASTPGTSSRPRLVVPDDADGPPVVHGTRSRGGARRYRATPESRTAPKSRAAVVYKRPLPYLYAGTRGVRQRQDSVPHVGHAAAGGRALCRGGRPRLRARRLVLHAERRLCPFCDRRTSRLAATRRSRATRCRRSIAP